MKTYPTFRRTCRVVRGTLALVLCCFSLAACSGGDGADDFETRCEGNVLIIPGGATLDCSTQQAYCEVGDNGEAHCTAVEGGGPINPDGSPRFLVLPLDYDAQVANGWEYNFAGNGAGHSHRSIDYHADVGTSLYASCSGLAMATSQYNGGYGYGQFIQIRCDTTSPGGLQYHLIYAHVSEVETFVTPYPASERWNQSYSDWAPVQQGDLIGASGQEDTVWPHLHFQVRLGSYSGSSVDPYDLYATTTSASHSAEQEYPPGGSRYVGCGPNYLWTACPPLPAQPQNLCPTGWEYHCGGSIGLDAGTLYRQCAGGTPEVQEVCTHGCDVMPGAEDDHCTPAPICPDGNGLYCGESVGLDTGTLYQCADGTYTVSQICANGCETMPAGADDQCSDTPACPDGDGLYCGESVGLTTGTLYQCAAGIYTEDQVCANGCEAMPVGQNDRCADSPCDCTSGACCDGCYYRSASYVCQPDADSEYGCPWGTSLGDDVGVRYRDRHCSGWSGGCDGNLGIWGNWQAADICNAQEVCVAGDPTCNPQGCTETDYWTPTSMTTTEWDSTGAVAQLRLEVEQGAGSTVRHRICKLAGTFINDIDSYFEDWVKYTGYVVHDGPISATGVTCSDWATLSTASWTDGDGLGGEVRVVSPDNCASQWGHWCNPAPNPGCGTCWFFNTSVMTRTCL